MKHEYFVEQPVLNLKEGIKVKADTELSYKSEKVEQTLENLVLETVLMDGGSNGVNAYHSVTHLFIHLNAGDILLFDANRGYYLPTYPVTSIDDAINDITSLSDIPRYKEWGD